MTILSGDRRLGERGERKGSRTGEHFTETATGTGTDDVLLKITTALQRSNHDTAIAAWTVTTIVMGLTIQVRTVGALESARVTLVVVGLLLPIFVAVGRVFVLLSRAAQAATDAGTAVGGAEGPPTGDAADLPPAAGRPDHPAPDHPRGPSHDRSHGQLNDLIATTRVRDRLARRALRWGYGSGVAFLAWSLLVAILSAGG